MDVTQSVISWNVIIIFVIFFLILFNIFLGKISSWPRKFSNVNLFGLKCRHYRPYNLWFHLWQKWSNLFKKCADLNAFWRISRNKFQHVSFHDNIWRTRESHDGIRDGSEFVGYQGRYHRQGCAGMQKKICCPVPRPSTALWLFFCVIAPVSH